MEDRRKFITVDPGPPDVRVRPARLQQLLALYGLLRELREDVTIYGHNMRRKILKELHELQEELFPNE